MAPFWASFALFFGPLGLFLESGSGSKNSLCIQSTLVLEVHPYLFAFTLAKFGRERSLFSTVMELRCNWIKTRVHWYKRQTNKQIYQHKNSVNISLFLKIFIAYSELQNFSFFLCLICLLQIFLVFLFSFCGFFSIGRYLHFWQIKDIVWQTSGIIVSFYQIIFEDLLKWGHFQNFQTYFQ